MEPREILGERLCSEDSGGVGRNFKNMGGRRSGFGYVSGKDTAAKIAVGNFNCMCAKNLKQSWYCNVEKLLTQIQLGIISKRAGPLLCPRMSQDVRGHLG